MPPLFNDMDVWLFPIIYPKELVHHPVKTTILYMVGLGGSGAAGIAMEILFPSFRMSTSCET